MLGVLDRFPTLASVGVVPLGISSFNREATMRPHTAQEAIVVVDQVAAWQEQFSRTLGRRLVYASDEYYLMASRPLPALAEYDGVPQHENGIGMARVFEHEVRTAAAGHAVTGTGPRSGFFAAVDGAPAEGYRAPRTMIPVRDASAASGARAAGPITLVTSAFGARVLNPVLDALSTVAGEPVRVLPVENKFFGGTIAVTGLLTGPDVGRALVDSPRGDRHLLPDVTLSRGVFLDGSSPADLPVAVEIVPTDGAALVAAVRAA